MFKLLALSLRRSRFTARYPAWLAPILLAIFLASPSLGQATDFAASRRVSLQGFAALSYVSPKYLYDSPTAGTDFGVVAGADVDVSAHIWVHPGFELRTTLANGPNTNQYTFGVGPRVIAPLGRVQPYADFLFGAGKIVFSQRLDPNYLSDQSSVYTYGGGTDVLLSRGWALKVDVQSQRWRLTHLQPPFYPLLVTFGVRYEVHGGKHSAPSR